MSAANGGGNGQAPTQQPASPAANGQAPTPAQANNSGSPQSAAPNGQAPTAIDQYNPPSADEWRRVQQELAESRRDAGKYRNDLQKLQDAQLSDAEKQAKRLADLEQLTTAQARELTEVKLTRAIERKAVSLNIVDPDAAARLLDWTAIDFDDGGSPKNLDKLLAALVQDKPWLVAQANANGAQQNGQGQPQRQAPAPSGGATNPGRQAGNGGLTLQLIQAMSPRERVARAQEIDAWDKAQRQLNQ